jgi:hypothetical protein
MPLLPSRVVDDNYDEPGVAETLMGLASYRASDVSPSVHGTAAHSPAVSSGKGQPPSPRPSVPHGNSVSPSTSRSRHSSPSRANSNGGNSLKRPLSAGPDELGDSKRSRIEGIMRKPSPTSGGRRTPVPSTRPSPIPFRTQPASHPSEVLQTKTNPQLYPPSPPLPHVLPPHPRPIGAGLPSHSNNSGPISLPPIAMLPPAPTASGPDDRMQVDSGPRSVSPPSRSALSEAIHHSGTSPKQTTPSPASSRHSQEKMEALT